MKVSVIIPVCNNDSYLSRCIDIIHANNAGFVAEIIVVSSQQHDDFEKLSITKGFKYYNAGTENITCLKNEGAKLATAEILYFLIPNILPPVAFDAFIVQAVDEGYYAGFFQIRFNQKKFLLNLYSYLSKFKWNLFFLEYRTLFVLKEAFEIIGGFQEKLTQADRNLIKKFKKNIDIKVIDKEVIVPVSVLTN